MKRITTIATALPPVAVRKAWEEVSASFDRFCLATGIETLGTMMEHNAEAACGPRRSRRRALGGAHQLLQNFLQLRIRVHWLRQLANDFALPLGGDLTIARKRREHLIVAEVLAPGLESFWRVADGLPEPYQRISEAVRIEIW